MRLEQKGHTTVITNTGNNTPNFFDQVNLEFHHFKHQNLIVDLSKDLHVTLGDVKLFTDIIKIHKEQKKSFVLVSQSLNFNLIPRDIILVPTINEAHDIIEMDEIERDLGF